MSHYYKLAKPDGWDFHTGKTINYRESVGKTVKAHETGNGRGYVLCTDTVIHASKVATDCLRFATVPFSAYIVEGKPVVEDEVKAGFVSLKVLEEIPVDDFDSLFGFKYREVLSPLDPRKIKSVMDASTFSLLCQWASVWASVRDSVRDSVWASEAAYMGSLFTGIKKWRYTEKLKVEGYPFQSSVSLNERGLVAATDGRGKWYLVHPVKGQAGEIVWTGTVEDARTSAKAGSDRA